MNATDLGNAVLNSWEAGDVAGTASVLADDFMLFGAGPMPLNKQAFLAFQQVNTTAFADWKFNHRSVGSNGVSSCFVLQITATHTGPFDVSPLGLPVPAIPATGKRRQWPQESLTVKARDGQLVEAHLVLQPQGGIVGTLAWLGVEIPAMPLSPAQIGSKWASLWNAGSDLSVIEEIVAPDFVSHSAPPGLGRGREGVKQWAQVFHRAFPNIYSNVEDVIVAGDKVVERFSSGGTHLGDFMGIPPTGRDGTITGINIFRLANGQIVEHWGNSDDMGMMRQLGLVKMGA